MRLIFGHTFAWHHFFVSCLFEKTSLYHNFDIRRIKNRAATTLQLSPFEATARDLHPIKYDTDNSHFQQEKRIVLERQ